MIEYIRKTNGLVEIKGGFRFPWQKRAPSQITESYEKKYTKLRKGTFYDILQTEYSVIVIVIGFLLATAYSATIGGLSTLVGTGTNVFAKGFVEE